VLLRSKMLKINGVVYALLWSWWDVKAFPFKAKGD
jgi:hypothetical protein